MKFIRYIFFSVIYFNQLCLCSDGDLHGLYDSMNFESQDIQDIHSELTSRLSSSDIIEIQFMNPEDNKSRDSKKDEERKRLFSDIDKTMPLYKNIENLIEKICDILVDDPTVKDKADQIADDLKKLFSRSNPRTFSTNLSAFENRNVEFFKKYKDVLVKENAKK
jgi:hypothetical protein